MRQASLCLLLFLAAVGQTAPVRQQFEEELDQLMKRFMFDNYDYDYTIDNHHEDESPEEHQRHATTTRRPGRKHQQRKTKAQKQKELREQQLRVEQEQKKRELEEQQAREQEQKEEKELKEAKEGGETQQQEEAVDGNGNSSAVDPQLREFTLIISKLLFHLSQL